MPQAKPRKKSLFSCYATSSCVDRRNMRDGIRVITHEELIPYMTGNRHMNCVHAASQLGCLDCIKWMVEHIGMHPNETDTRYGASPLHYAASAGHLKVIKFLLPRLARIIPDYDGASPLHDAAVQGHITCVQELLKSPLINADLTDNYGLTAAEWAEQAQEKKCAKLLRECMKKTAATLKKKKHMKKDKHGMSGTPAFSQYSDSTESHSSSPSSETYAQLEPSDCVCVGNSSQHDIPPKLPDTPRPSKHNTIHPRDHSISSPSRHPRYKQRRPSNESIPSSRDPSSDRKMSLEPITEQLPPPPDSMLQSMIAANIRQTPTTPPPPEIQQAQAADQHCYYVHNLEFTSGNNNNNKPMSAVQPFNHQPPLPPPPPERNQSTHLTIGSHTYNNSSVIASPLTTPPAPMHSFSTFITDNRGGSSSSSKHSSPQHTASTSTGASTGSGDYGYMQGAIPVPPPPMHGAGRPPAMMRQGSYGSQYSSTSDMNPLAHAVSQMSFHNPPAPPQAFENLGYTTPQHNQPTTPEQIQPSVPQWKQQLLDQRARKQQQEKQQMAEISETPDWKRLIQERKQQATKDPQARQDSFEDEVGLAPWQSELKRTGKVIPIELE